MPIDFGMRIMPGVRISASSRGIRTGIGPRAARLHVGSGGIGASTGVGPFTAYTGTGRRRRRSSLGSSLQAYERELRRAQREQEIAEVAKKERQLVSVHLEEFPPAQPQRAPSPAPADHRALLNDFQRQALSGIPWYKRSERRTAKQVAAQQAESAIEAEEQRRTDAQAEEQARLDASWRQLTITTLRPFSPP